MKGLAPEALALLKARDLIASDPEMDRNVGRRVRFAFPGGWKPEHGTITRDHEFEIVGVQKDYRGRLVYRVLCDNGIDAVGRCANPHEIEFIDGG